MKSSLGNTHITSKSCAESKRARVYTLEVSCMQVAARKRVTRLGTRATGHTYRTTQASTLIKVQHLLNLGGDGGLGLMGFPIHLVI